MNNANDRETAKAFIRKHFIKADTKVCTMSSYRLKHELQYDTNVYLTEQDFVKLMEELGYGHDYLYSHDFPNHFVKQQFMPDELQGTKLWHAQGSPQEQKMAEWMKYLWEKEE